MATLKAWGAGVRHKLWSDVGDAARSKTGLNYAGKNVKAATGDAGGDNGAILPRVCFLLVSSRRPEWSPLRRLRMPERAGPRSLAVSIKAHNWGLVLVLR